MTTLAALSGAFTKATDYALIATLVATVALAAALVRVDIGFAAYPATTAGPVAQMQQP